MNSLIEPHFNETMTFDLKGCNASVKTYMEIAVDTNKQHFTKYVYH